MKKINLNQLLTSRTGKTQSAQAESMHGWGGAEEVMMQEGASNQHPISTYSAPIQHPLQSGGNQVAGRYLARIWKYAAMLIMLLTLGVGEMWGDITFSGGYIYFDNSLGINSSTLQICARQSSWTGVSTLSNISNTKLYYVANPQGSGWGGILGWVVISANPAKSNSNFDNWSSYTWCSDWNTYGFNSGSTYLIVPSSTSKSQSVTTSYYSGGYGGLNSTQTIKSVVRTGGGTYSQANSKATISITSYKLTGNGAVTKQTTSLSTSASSQTVSAARTATTTYTVGDVADGYEFDGWYTAATGGSLLSSSTTYTHYPTAATTVYARFTQITYSLAGESWTNSSAVTWTPASTQKLSTSDGITYSVTMSGEAASAKQFKVLKNETFDGAIAYDTDGVTKICYNGTLADAGAGQNHNFTLTPYLAGDVTVSYNTSTKTLTITCEAPLITFNKASGSGGSDNQKTYSGMNTSNISTPSRSGYAFQGYWSDDATPIQVINSSGAWIANKTGYTQNTSPVKWATGLNANHTFTAHWNANNYTIALDNQSATTAGTPNVSATFDASTNLTSAITKPTKTGYIFGGYFTGTGGTGTQIIGADGYFIASAGGGSTYTDANKKWKYADNISLKAYWIPITVSATISPSTGATGATKDFTFSITSNVGTGDGYEVAVYSFGTVNSGEPNTASYLNSTVSYNASPKSYTASSIGGFSTAGNYTTKAVVLKGGTLQATSVAITYSAGDYYTVSFNMQGHGSDVASQNILSGSTATEPSPAPTATGYTFGGWYQEPGCTNAYNFSTSVTANKTLYAKWTANTYTVSFDQQSGTGGSSSVTATYGSNMPSATMPTRTGYTFGGYYTAVDGGGTKYYNANGTSARTWNIDDDTDLYAKWTERTVTVSPTNSYDAGDPEYSNPTVTNSGTIGIASSSTLTAPAAGTGYTFAGWSLSNNIYVVSGTPATDREITIRHKTGDGSAVTATATYNEVLTSNWHIVGTPTSIFGGASAWATADGNMLRKATGHSTDDEGSLTINVTALGANNSSYQFKVKNASTTVVYGWSNSDYYYMDANATKTTNVYSADSHPLYFIPDALGNYVFSVNWSGTYPSLTVTWPTSYAIQYSKGTVNGSTGNVTAKYNTVAFNSNTKIQSGQTITLIAPDEKEGYTWAGWFNNNAGSGDALSTNKTYTPTVSAATTYYACYTINNHAITHSAATNGDYTIKVGSAAAVNTNTTADYGTNITLAEQHATGYHFTSWSVTKTVGGDAVSVSSNQFTMPDAAVTVAASFTANTYTITLHEQGATTHGSPSDGGEITVTYDANTNLGSITSLPERTGYTFNGYYDNAACTGSWIIKTDKYFNWDGTYINSTTGTWQYDGNLDLYAKWVANQYTVTLDVDEANKGTIDGATTSQDIYYDDATVTVPNRPTAANGYALDGYYTDHNGGGTKVINGDGTWIASVTGYTDGSKHWIHADDVTLYAYYKKAEITAITFDAAVVETKGTVSFAVTVVPTPVEPTKLCFTVLHSNDNPLDVQPEINYSAGKYSFTAPEASGTYKVEAVLRTGTGCDGGTELDTEVANFQVAGIHTVTVRYKCGDDVIKAATTVTGRPLDWSDAISAPEIFGYTFSSWTAGDGVTLTDDNGTTTKTTTTAATIKIKAIYDGSLTANYTQNAIIYFKNTLGWSDVYVNFYESSYWNNPKGSGNSGVTNRNKHMTQIGETDIWYYDYGAASISPSLYVSFTSASQDGSENFWKSGGVNVVYPANYPDAINIDKSSENGFKAATPMFVPLATQDGVTLNSSGGGKADYYNAGYWTKYTPGTGYTLEIYNSAGNALLKSVEFTSEDELMPMKAVVDLEAGQTYKYQLRRGGTGDNGIYYGNSGTMTYASHGDPTPWDMSNGSFSMCGITTNAAGDYTFNLSYSGHAAVDPHYRLRMAVDYPIASGDYRVIYKHTGQTNWKASAIVPKVINGKDTVSFFIRPGSTPYMNIQQSSVNSSTGEITWSNYYSVPTETLTALTKDGVYNVCIAMNGSGGASVSKIEPYTGNYYIRVDAANSKWDNYRSDPDHLMTYSEYSIEHGGYSHYYCHWVDASDSRKNVKFCIANDYSPSISDTLIRETASGTWANIGTYIESNGDLKRNANVRFMWDQSTNEISRAYIDGAQTDGSRFLVISSTDGKIKKADGSALSNNEVTFSDNENWIYEANVKAQPNALIKLLSNWGTGTVITQYFKGGVSTTEKLIGGSGTDWYDIRLLYDFKTNRLIASWVPSSGTISDDRAINADIMFIREHQGDIAQLTLTGSGEISEIKTAYGVMRFNKWTLANKSKEEGHAVLGDPKSIYERSLYWISFPFRVKLSEVIGFGTYGTHWAVQRYDGAGRAANGYWAESSSFWRWMNRNTEYLEPNQGYLLAIDVDLLGESSDVWGPMSRSEQIEIYFPSYGTMPDITKATVTCTIPSHACTINWAETKNLPDTGDPRTSYNRTVFDSHWNVISVPTYVNTNDVTFANTTWTGQIGPNFLYTWNADDHTITATSASGYTYHAMHAYMVQYGGNITWDANHVSSIVARKTYAESPSRVEFRLELQQNEKMIDRTYVALSNDEQTSAGFRFGEDMTKEFNANKSSIYTFIANEATVAGNTLPMTEQTTVVPMGVEIKTAGDYTFAIPDGTEGIGVTLIDTETGIRTSLSALDYTINLPAGKHDGRFVLEISPVSSTTTGVEATGDGLQETGARKVMIDGLLYIVKDGALFDATGKRVE